MAKIANAVNAVALTAITPAPIPITGITILSNETLTDLGVGLNRINSTTPSGGPNDGYIKFFVGEQTVFIQFWISP